MEFWTSDSDSLFSYFLPSQLVGVYASISLLWIGFRIYIFKVLKQVHCQL